MGADGGIYFIRYTKETLMTYLLEMLIEWLCSDKCSYKFDGCLQVIDDTIKHFPEEDTSDDKAVPLFSDEQLAFITQICDSVVEHFTSHCHIPDDYSDMIMTTDEYLHRQRTDWEFCFTDPYVSIWHTEEFDEVWNGGWLWMYWDTGCYYFSDPFSGKDGLTELKEMYDRFSSDIVFKQIFTDFTQFSRFVYDLPETEYIQMSSWLSSLRFVTALSSILLLIVIFQMIILI